MAAKCVSTVMGRIGGGAVRRSDRASLRGLLKTELAAQHGGTLIQNLNADDTAREDRLPGSFAFVPCALGIDQQIGVEKRRYLAFASVRSKANPLGIGNARARIRSTAQAR